MNRQSWFITVKKNDVSKLLSLYVSYKRFSKTNFQFPLIWFILKYQNTVYVKRNEKKDKFTKQICGEGELMKKATKQGAPILFYSNESTLSKWLINKLK